MHCINIIGGNVVRLTQGNTPAGGAGVEANTGVCTGAVYTTKSALLFVVQVLIRSLLVWLLLWILL